jgi:hypothetical protein
MIDPVVLSRVPGVHESDLTDEALDQLPAGDPPPAPWTCRASAVLWLARAPRAARAALPPALRDRRPVGVVGGMVRYRDTPVGAYDEVFGQVGYLRGGRPRSTVALMAVDSPASLVGGRANWAMPKALVRFDGDPTTSMTASTAGWRVTTRVRPLGPALPIRTTAIVEQQGPDGVLRTCRMVAHGRLRPALVRTEVRSTGPLARWLRPGPHLGLVGDEIEFTLSPTRPLGG